MNRHRDSSKIFHERGREERMESLDGEGGTEGKGGRIKSQRMLVFQDEVPLDSTESASHDDS